MWGSENIFLRFQINNKSCWLGPAKYWNDHERTLVRYYIWSALYKSAHSYCWTAQCTHLWYLTARLHHDWRQNQANDWRLERKDVSYLYKSCLRVLRWNNRRSIDKGRLTDRADYTTFLASVYMYPKDNTIFLTHLPIYLHTFTMPVHWPQVDKYVASVHHGPTQHQLTKILASSNTP